jgi:cobalt/nickel transport system permease protein
MTWQRQQERLRQQTFFLILHSHSRFSQDLPGSRHPLHLSTRGMHIIEGYLPLTHAVGWTLTTTPFVVHGYRALRRQTDTGGDARFALAAAAAFTFLLSALKIPSVAGSSSHPTGTALGTLLVGAPIMALVSVIVLLLQALLLAHGGLTTLGANVFSMGVVGPWCALAVFRGIRRIGAPVLLAAAAAAIGGDLATYLTTSVQLAVAHPEVGGSVGAAFARFVSVFGVTQLPIAVLEGALTVLVLRALPKANWRALEGLGRPRTYGAASGGRS